MYVCHSCDTPECVNVNHLFLGTHRDNDNDRHAKGRDARGSRHGMAKLSEADIATIRLRRGAGETPRSIAESYGVHLSLIYLIAKRKNWKHVG